MFPERKRNKAARSEKRKEDDSLKGRRNTVCKRKGNSGRSGERK
jgi:hypothetical protein